MRGFVEARLKTVSVFGKKIKVKYALCEDGFAGFYVPDEHVIVLDPRSDKEARLHTLLHEMGHALFHRAGLMQSKLPLELEEVIVEQFATMLLENFKLTPK